MFIHVWHLHHTQGVRQILPLAGGRRYQGAQQVPASLARILASLGDDLIVFAACGVQSQLLSCLLGWGNGLLRLWTPKYMEPSMQTVALPKNDSVCAGVHARAAAIHAMPPHFLIYSTPRKSQIKWTRCAIAVLLRSKTKNQGDKAKNQLVLCCSFAVVQVRAWFDVINLR